MHPRPPRIWTHKHARIVRRHSPHNNNKNPSARLRPAARHIMSSLSLGRDSATRSHVITAAGASSQITRPLRTPRRGVVRSFRSPPPRRRPSTFPFFPSPSLLAVCPIPSRYSAFLPRLHFPALAAYPNVPPSQGRMYSYRDSSDIPFAVGFR